MGGATRTLDLFSTKKELHFSLEKGNCDVFMFVCFVFASNTCADDIKCGLSHDMKGVRIG